MSGAPTATTLFLSLPTTINYSDGSSDTLPANTLAVLPDTTTEFDRTHDVYVGYTIKRSGVLSIIKEALLPTLTSDYAPICRVELHGITPYQPEPSLTAGGTSGGLLRAMALIVSTVPAVGGSTTTPVPTTSTDYVVNLVLGGSQAAAVWNALGDQALFSDLQILFGSTEIDVDIDQTAAVWSSSYISLWFKLQRPIAANSSDYGYALHVGGTVRSNPPRAWANIYPFADDFSGSALSANWATSGVMVATVSGGRVHLALSAATSSTLTCQTSFAEGYRTDAWGTANVSSGGSGDCRAYVVTSGAGSSAALQPTGVVGTSHITDIAATGGGDTGNVDTGVIWSATDRRWAIARDGTGKAYFWLDALALSAASHFWTGAAAWQFFIGSVPQYGTWSVDWVKTRPWVATEPTVTAGAITTGGGGVPAPGAAAEGSLLYYHTGAWSSLGIGTSGQELTVVSGDPAWTDQPADSDSAGTVTSVDVAAPSPLASAGGPITSSGTITLTWATGQTANRVLASPNGSSGAVSLRALVAADIPSLDASKITAGQLALARGGSGLDASGVTDGQLLIGQSSDHTLGLATLTAGSGVTITNAGHSVTIAASGGSGTVTSVALTLPAIFNLSGSPITTSGTLVVTLANANTGTVFAGPSSGSAAAPTFRALAGSDLPAAAGAGGHVHAHGHFL